MNKKIVGFLPIFLIAFFILIANPAQAATSAECKAAATKCIAPCSVSTPSLLACKSKISLYTNACWLKFPYNGQAPQFVTGALDSNAIFSAEANKFADNNLVIDEGTANPYPCSISYPQNCTDEASCTNIKYFWQGGKCVKTATDQCTKDMDCANDQYCDIIAKPKSCVAKKADGVACSAANQCTGGFCNAGKCANSLPTCKPACNEVNEYCNGTACVAKKKPGEICTVLTQCLTGVCVGGKCGCNDDVDCETTQFCDTTKICKDKLITGKPCTKVSQCLSNICLEGYCKCTPPNKGCTDTQYCDEAQSCSVKKKDAKACKYNYECQTNDCSGTPNKTCGGVTGCATDCTADGTHFCKIDADGGATCLQKKLDCQPCTADDNCKSGTCGTDKKCKGGTTCPADSGALGAEGAACADDSECASDNCNPSTKKCMADLSCDENHLSKCLNGPLCLNAGGHWWKSDSKCHAEIEGTCQKDSDCAGGQYCHDFLEQGKSNQCQADKYNGVLCDGPNECQSGYCVNAVCSDAPNYKCAPACTDAQFCSATGCKDKKAEGEKCEWDNQCKSNACKGDGDTCSLSAPGGADTSEPQKKTCETACTTDKWCDATVPVCKLKIEENGVCTKAEQCKTAYCSPTGKCTTAPAGTGGTGGTGATPSEFGLPNFLGVDDPSVVIGRIIKFIMGFVGTIALIIFIYGGVLWLISAGRDELVTKGKNAMVWSAIGLVIVFSGYILVKFVFSLFGK